jgi:hypothetical protein
MTVPPGARCHRQRPRRDVVSLLSQPGGFEGGVPLLDSEELTLGDFAVPGEEQHQQDPGATRFGQLLDFNVEAFPQVQKPSSNHFRTSARPRETP